MPDGCYEFEDKLDDDGITGNPIRIHAKLAVQGDAMSVDLSGCSPQVSGPTNATLASTYSAVFYALMAAADVPIASNAGCYRPVTIIAPPGLVVNAADPAPVVHRVAITHRLSTVLFGALHQAVPDRMPAAYYAVSYVVSFQTIDPKLGRKVLVEIEIGGCGALPYADGASAHAFGMHNNSNIPIEMIEGDTPITVVGYGLMQIQAVPGGSVAGSGFGGSGASSRPRRGSRQTSIASGFRPSGWPAGAGARLSAPLSDPRWKTGGVALEAHQLDAAQG